MMSVGDIAHDIALVNKDNKNEKLSQIANGKNLLIIFYPKDGTSICTSELCLFGDNLNSFKDTKVIGVSKDSPESHAKFKDKNKIPFDLYTDLDGTAMKALGLKNSLFIFPPRTTILLDKDLKCLFAYSDQTNIKQHLEGALKANKE